MKESFFLYFLVLSPLIFSQNSLQYNIEGYNNVNSIFDKSDLTSLSNKNLIILDKNFTDKHLNLSMIDSNAKELHENEFSTLHLIEQLKELNYSTPFNIVHNPTLERFIRVYLKNRREDLSSLRGKAKYYFPMFEEHLDKYNLPLEIKYLAVVESALTPDAISSSGAKGLWQFMLGTGKENGLEVNSYVDERFDPLKSTEAACKYLLNLYNTFKDWDLVLAAYNSGPGNVKKAIVRSGGKRNYWEIRSYLPQETKSYVPAFYATFYIFEYANIHQLEANYSELTYLDVDTVHVKRPLDFKSIQKRISINNELLKVLNPQYKKGIVPFSKNKEYTLTLPKNLILEFIENEKFFYQTTHQSNTLKNRSNSLKVTEYNSYKVEIGDNLTIIAIKHQITLKQLKNWNGLQTNYLIEGQRLVITDEESYKVNQPKNQKSHNNNVSKIPFSPKVSPNFSSDISKKRNPGILQNFETYIVKKGDTLFNISRRYRKVTVNQLRNWNDINDVKFLKPGTKLKIFKS